MPLVDWLMSAWANSSLGKWFDLRNGNNMDELEREFLASWGGVEAYYSQESRAKRSASLLKLVAEMRSRGFDKSFRAGQQMTNFIVSRAKENGLRPEQPNINFSVSESGVDVEINIDGRHRVFLPEGEFTPEIEQWLRRLEMQPVD